MRTVIPAKTHTLLSVTHEELVALANCVNEILNNSSIDSNDCGARIGVSIDELSALQRALCACIDSPRSENTEVFEAWRDGFSIQLKAVSAFGDPADLSAGEVKAKLAPLIQEAEEI